MQVNTQRRRNGVDAAFHKDILSLLSPQAIAEYKLYEFCLESKEFSRAMDFLVRKKKSKKDKDLLNQREVSSISKMGNNTLKSTHSSLALPTTELKLVQCTSRANTLIELGWDLVHSLRR